MSEEESIKRVLFYYKVQLHVQIGYAFSSGSSSPITQSGLALHFSDIIAKKVRVVIEPVRMLDEVFLEWHL